MDRTQQLQCVYHVLQTAVQRPPGIYENAMEILNSRWDATNKEHDWETLGGTFQSPQVWSRELFSYCQWFLSLFTWRSSLLNRKLIKNPLDLVCPSSCATCTYRGAFSWNDQDSETCSGSFCCHYRNIIILLCWYSVLPNRSPCMFW